MHLVAPEDGEVRLLVRSCMVDTSGAHSVGWEDSYLEAWCKAGCGAAT